MFKKHPWAKAGLIVAVLLVCYILAFGWLVRVPQGTFSLTGSPTSPSPSPPPPPKPVYFATTHRAAADALAVVFAPAIGLLEMTGDYAYVTLDEDMSPIDSPSLLAVAFDMLRGR